MRRNSGRNQPELYNWDQIPWMSYRQQLYRTLTDQCRAAGIAVATQWYEVPYHTAPRIVTMLFWDLLPGLQHWIDQDQQLAEKGQTLTVVTDNAVAWQDLARVKFRPCKEILGMASNYQDRAGLIKPAKRWFSCFMQRADSVRQSWLYFLHNRNLLDRGYVSYLLLTKGSDSLSGQALFDRIHFDNQLDQLPHFQSAYQSLRDRMPLRNFSADADIVDLLWESEFSVCLETYATEDEHGAWCWTEKSLRDLQLPISSLPFMQRGAARQLELMGLSVPDYVFEIDDLPWTQRQAKILDLLDHGSLESREQARDRAVYNNNLLTSWLRLALAPDYFTSIVEEARCA